MDSVTEPVILQDGIPAPVASGRKSARFRETSLPVGICPRTGQKQKVKERDNSVQYNAEKGDNLDVLDIRRGQGVRVATSQHDDMGPREY